MKENTGTFPHIKDSAQFFLQDYNVVHKSHSQYTNNPSPYQIIDSDKLPIQIYDIDGDEEKNEKVEDFQADLLKPETEKSKKASKELRVS